MIDNEESNDTSEAFVEVYQPNRSPDKPVIEGPTSATINEDCKFTIKSEDPDNDSINITIDWDDGTKNSTGFTKNNIVNFSHSWSFIGCYNIQVEVTDGNKTSFSTFSIAICRNIKADLSSIDNPDGLCSYIFVIIVLIILLIIFFLIKRIN
ncbi:MAG TPA: hypothetical protein ENI44_02630 [Thermoplasmatales archaeon]|nr:hypothetical protein [Thermoplasmatales archaeon]